MGPDAATIAVLADVCPSCLSGEVRAIETGYFVLELDRADEMRANGLEDVEFSCRACGVVWH